MSSRHLYRSTMIGALGSVCWLASGSAQTITGNISGTVTDPSGAVVVGATVTATNVSTGVSATGQTNGAGLYSLRFLQVGRYKVTVDSPGFSKATYGPFALEIDQTAKVDAKLTLGSESATVQVDEAAPILNTENAAIATTFTNNTIENLPLNGRNFSSLTIFMPGAVTTQPTGMTGQNAIERDTNQAGQTAINGNRNQTNNYLLDGVEINETINNVIGYNPSPDALEQVQVISANAPAEYGNVNGGDVIALTKSGTNSFHGSAFGYLQNYNLDANTWSNKYQHLAQSHYTQSIFGATLGGPIKRDKLFFFVDYSAARYGSAGSSSASVATAAMRTGDFSALLSPNFCSTSPCTTSQTVQLYDPNNNFAPYVNDQVPIVSPAAKYLFAHPELYPLPNTAPTPGTLIKNNYQATTKTNQRNDQGDVKIDWTPTQRDRISGRYLQGEAYDFATQPLAIQFPGSNSYPTKGVALNYVRTFTPALVNEFRGGFTRIRWIQGVPTDSTGVFGTKGNSLLGIPGTQPYSGFSALNITGGGNIGNSAGGTNFIDNIFSYGDNLTWQHGRHTVKIGAQFVRYQQNNFYPGNDGAMGQFSYNGNYTSNPQAATGTNLPSATGSGFADFVLDRANFVGIGSVTGRTGQRQWRDAGFIQDDFRVMPNLTFNLGLRYEYDQPIYEVNNKQANVNPATGQAVIAGTAAAAALGDSRALYRPVYTNFMPRVGFAYQATPKFVLRGGYGITNDLEGTGANLRLTFNPPFQSSFELTGTSPSASSAGVSFPLENGFTSGAANYNGTTYRAWDPNLRPSFIGEYSLTTEYALTNTTSLSVGYVGESGQHLIQAVALNQLRQPCVIGGVVQSTPNSAACAAANPAPYQALVGQSGAVVGTLSYGMMNYNALQVVVRQRTQHGLEYTVNYTYGRAMTNSNGFFGVANISGPSPYAENAYNNRLEYGPSGFDVRNNLNGTVVYALPFGRGRQFGSGINPFLDELVGGWKLAMSAVAYSGFPVNPNDNNNNAYTNNRAQRANQLRKLKIVNRSVGNWFGTDPSTVPCGKGQDNGTCAYQQPSDGTYGNAAVNSLRGPGYQQYDFSGFKDFALFREYKLGFRVDAFNAFNIASYGNPDNTVQDTNFGQITNTRSPQRQIQFSANFKF